MKRRVLQLAGQLQRVPRGFKVFFATSLAARSLGIVCQILQVPLVVHALGAEAFGLWMAMTSISGVVLFADLGMGIGAQNRLAELFAHHRQGDARLLLGSVFLFLAGIGAILGALLTLVLLPLDFGRLFHLHDSTTIAEAPTSALVLGWIFCAGFPFGLAQRLAFARQEGWQYNVAQAGGSLGALAMVTLVVSRHGSLVALIAGAQGALLCANVVLLGVQLRQLHWLDVWRFTFSFAVVRRLLRLGACFSIQQILTTVLFSLPQVVISTCLGAAAVTPYNLLQRLFNLFAVVQNAFMLPLWPAYSKARAHGEFAWMRAALRNSLRATAWCSVLPMAVGAAFAPLIIRLWIGRSVVALEPALIWLLCAWNAVVFFQQPFNYLLSGVSEVRRTTLYSVLSAAASAALMYALAAPLGAPGVVLGLLCGYVPFNFIGCIVETRRYLRSTPAAAGPGSVPASLPAPSS
ncbi:MAG TPA: lipopolysaccharide biosynthesis protein [Opitutus sp.]|nr:lipopolysaccharide biosynthesis protein [Opitutus sp.]